MKKGRRVQNITLRLCVLTILLIFLIPLTFSNIFLSNGLGEQTTEQMYNQNWAGYQVVSSFSNPQPVFEYISASWEVQKVGSHIYGTTVSSQWAGIGGHFTGDALIQAGTASYATGGYGHRYFAWYEMLPTSSQSGNSSAVQVFSVSPGDVIDVEISEWGQSSSTWQITIGDVTNGMLYQNIFTYTPDMKYAEWIEERTQLNKDHLANFGTAHFGPYFTGISNNPNEVEDSANSVFYNIGQLPNYNITMYNDTSNRNLAVPGPLFGTIYQSDSFNVTWKNPY